MNSHGQDDARAARHADILYADQWWRLRIGSRWNYWKELILTRHDVAARTDDPIRPLLTTIASHPARVSDEIIELVPGTPSLGSIPHIDRETQDALRIKWLQLQWYVDTAYQVTADFIPHISLQ